MGRAEVSIIHHLAFVLLVLWILNYIGRSHPFAFFIALLYLYEVNQSYSKRLWRRLQFEERKSANQNRLLLDSESVRWLNHVVERAWPICMEQIASKEFLLPIIPWFLENYKPWTAKEAAVRHLYLGRNPPTFTEIRVLHEPDGDDDMILELGLNFISAEDIDAELVVQLRKRLGFGMRAKMHVTGMHVEGKILVGLKFIDHWPFIGHVRVCFVEAPYFQMTIKPIFHHGVDVTEVPGIAGWLDKLLAIVFEETLVEPNMLVVDVEKFASRMTDWFTIYEKHPIAFAKVEVIEAADMKAGDISGFADPYVKGQLGPYRFRTKIQKKTLAPRWQEEFKIPISSWEAPNELIIQVCDKDRMFNDTLGECHININKLIGGQRHDKWFTLRNIRTGRLHLAITVLEENEKDSNRGKSSDDGSSEATEATTSRSPSSKKLSPIKGGCRPDEDSEFSNSPESFVSTGSDGSNDNEGDVHGNHRFHRVNLIQRGLRKISNKLHKDKNGHDPWD
ncbi:uncharacterized protein A4U43_C05F28790 [Asparagus officinalis]|uniref:C2 domain-containing protein n=1 Tax=Asparagus officinalis TaxID=4686 RepID=A0A5P1EVU8_ASPOF|nr:C2 domain-containing protein At1g53590-like [Asparagus officinalis]ONK69964.1 uncharacterized protein A4U43_C05F28790 [Asparagus officinalis]